MKTAEAKLAYLRKWRAANKDKVKQYNDKWKLDNPQYNRDYARRFRSENPEVWKEIWRRSHFKSKYGLTLEERNGLIEKQSNLCALCGRSGNGKRRSLFV